MTPTNFLLHYMIQIADHPFTQKDRKKMHAFSCFLPLSERVHYLGASCSVSGAKV